MYDQKKKELEKRAIHEEQRYMQAKPIINNRSRAMASSRSIHSARGKVEDPAEFPGCLR